MVPAVAPQVLEHPFAAIIFDWDGTAVMSRHEDTTGLARLAETLLHQQVWLVIVTGTNFPNIDRQFCGLVAPRARHHLLVCTNRGSEVYGFDATGATERRYLRVATPQEDAALSATAEDVRDALRARTGLDINIIYDRLNRRKIDLIPLPEWVDPPKSRIGQLVQAVEARLHGAGLSGGIAEAIDLTKRSAAAHGLGQARITSDVKHIEVGLTDKGDSVDWVKRELLQPAGIALRNVLIAGDEFGPIAGFAGSDDRLRHDVEGAVVVSVGVEPSGAPSGVLHLGGGPAQFRALLVDQVCLRYEAAHPAPYPVPARDCATAAMKRPEDRSWYLAADGYVPALEHSVESRFATANGSLGVRGALAQPTKASHPAIFVAGLFDTAEPLPGAPEIAALVPLQDTSGFRLLVDGKDLDLGRGTLLSLRRWLDLRRGVSAAEWLHCDPEGHSVRMQLLRFTSLRQRTLHVRMARIAVAQPASMRIMAQPERPNRNLTPVRSTAGVTIWQTVHSAHRLEQASTSSLCVAGEAYPEDMAEASPDQQWTWCAAAGQPATFTRILSMAWQPPGGDAGNRAVAALERASSLGAEHLLAAHERAWAERWAASDIVIEGDDEAQRALRFALYHLISAANPREEHVSIGARGLTGEAYLGHTFWDTDIFMLPFYIFTWPAAARSLLMYRYHTLPAARAKAARLGYRGALYAWESADTGEEATPPFVGMPGGRIEPVRSGLAEHHISADVAYAVWQYWQATGDTPFILRAGAEILLDTARFWCSRVALEADGRYHIRQVIGPDEYHTGVDDNAYTNEMARWNIERGLEIAAFLAAKWPDRWSELSHRLDVTPGELSCWRSIAATLAVDHDPATGLIEQFAGFTKLEQIDLRSLPSLGIPVDMILGAERTQRSQIIKQADVVMLLTLLWDRYPPDVREANVRYYEPRCAHGSSLSPPIHALVAARLGDTELADRYLHQTAAIDLDDTMGNAALGVHLGALGGLWQAVAFGFTGCALCPDGLRFDPHLPPSWRTLQLPVRWHGRLVRITVEQPPLRLAVTLERGRALTLYLPGLHHRLRAGQSWHCRWDEHTQRWQEADI